jgi:RHS repeat-associated protein
LYEYQGGATTLYYEGNALRRTGYAADNGVFYLLQDQLKSSSTLANQNGTVNSRNYFYPFGGNRGGAAFSALTTKRFTGQYHEQGLPGGEGLSYYGARWYDAQLGRFASPDTVVPGPGNPQAFNRYSYVFNNPLRLVDPSGHDPIGCDSCEDRRDRRHGDLGGTSTSPFYPTPSRGCVSIMCLPTSVPQPTFLPWWAPVATPGPRFVAPTATPAPELRRAPPMTPTATPIPNGSVSMGTYWSGFQAYLYDVPEKLASPSLIGNALGKYAARSVPWIGWGFAVGPDVIENLQSRNFPELGKDFVVDTVGFGFSSVTGPLVGAVGTTSGLLIQPEAAPVTGIIGYVTGSIGGSYFWDVKGGPWFRSNVVDRFSSWLFGK